MLWGSGTRMNMPTSGGLLSYLPPSAPPAQVEGVSTVPHHALQQAARRCSERHLPREGEGGRGFQVRKGSTLFSLFFFALSFGFPSNLFRSPFFCSCSLLLVVETQVRVDTVALLTTARALQIITRTAQSFLPWGTGER